MTILQSTLDLLRARLDAAFQVSDPRAEDWVMLTNPVELDGRISEHARNKVIMSLVGLQSEPTAAPSPGFSPATGDRFARVAAPLHLNAFVLFLANFTEGNYATGLGMLSRTISFFQQSPVFTPDRLPGLPREVDRIVLDFVNLDLMQTNYLMGMLGLKYLPSALYRLRMLTFAGEASDALVPVARNTRPADAGAATE
ncbi:DUF4255 domain-containing protein [Bradyrhizobium sp. 2TAF24]|uniref:DUF4255 domain-containing protein n=1 Tax=Bradyrhizobium sp. 2TAF24 TaxID=3233011 RepID=UPI003F920217